MMTSKKNLRKKFRQLRAYHESLESAVISLEITVGQLECQQGEVLRAIAHDLKDTRASPVQSRCDSKNQYGRAVFTPLGTGDTPLSTGDRERSPFTVAGTQAPAARRKSQDTMKSRSRIYEITALVTAPVQVVDGNSWDAIREIPAFYIKTASAKRARILAQRIIDPVKIAEADITVTRISQRAFRRAGGNITETEEST
jgi:hypothetical protein